MVALRRGRERAHHHPRRPRHRIPEGPLRGIETGEEIWQTPHRAATMFRDR